MTYFPQGDTDMTELVGRPAFGALGATTPSCVQKKTCKLISNNIYWTQSKGVGPDMQPSNCYNAGTNKFENQAMCANSGVANPWEPGKASKFVSGFLSVFMPQQPATPAGAPMGPVSSGMPSWVVPVAIGGVALVGLMLLTKKKKS